MISFTKLIIHRFKMPLKFPFANSNTTIEQKDIIITELHDQDGFIGYGESVAFDSPWYTEETADTVQYMVEHHLWPVIKKEQITHPTELNLHGIRRNHMAKTAIEGAVWDLYAKRQNKPLYQVIGGTTNKIPVGAAVGLQSTDDQLLEKIAQALNAGYQRIKLKIKPENDLHTLEKVREHFPVTPLMVDANSAYTIADIAHLKKMDEYNLMMIEQPLAPDDFIDHAKLQQAIDTPICLDESIHTLADVRTAITLNSCKVISIKLAKVGGFSNAINIHDYCREHHVPVWCGGMLEAGVGRAQSLALATLPNFTLPADPGASNRYWHQDIISPEVEVNNGYVTLPEQPGIGYHVQLPITNQKVLT
ncbi:o-succinylbenzoate synthase [Gracilibacillus sp. S3-1-1]|uniref:O-succinylbenzoate synthase n=1 Tax=Gracilibacillus pellucidus TaxID=3095368 RepID=A0ACC6M2A9_9BACI|nr:o-succinylbenzoate synthase [Gracilibacillus sp. S3-1-1]MDX8045048.1 o-succinylbenzoate synthase [Gracilibacillus sp. S3-1-1]